MNHVNVDYDPFSLDVMRDPQPFYKRLRTHAPVYRMEKYDGWALSRFDDVYTALLERDRMTDSEGQVLALDTVMHHHQGHRPPATPTEPLTAFTLYDPPLHTRIRRVMAGPLHPSAVMQLESYLRQVSREVVDKLIAKGTFDANFDFGSQIACASSAAIVGLGDIDRAKLIDLVNRSVAREPGQPGFTETGRQASAEIGAMIAERIALRRAGKIAEPCPLIDCLLNDTDILGRPLTDAEITMQMALIFIGGTESLPKVMAAGLMELWRHPDQRAYIAADRTRCATAVEEMVRLHAPAQWFGRTLLCDMEVAGTPMRAGQRLFLLLASANRDEREFEDPDTFRANRHMRRVVAFGVGPHFCSGLFLARLEARIMLEEFLARITDYEVDLDRAERNVSEFQIGYMKLPITIKATRQLAH